MGLLLAVFLLFLPKKKKKTICNRHSIFKQTAFQVQGTQLHPETPLSFTPSWSSSPVKMSSIYRIKSLSLCQKYLIGPNFLTKTAESPSLTSGKAERAEGVVALLSQLCCSVHWLHPLLCPAPRVTFSSGLRHSHLGARMWTQHLNSHCGWWRPSYQNQQCLRSLATLRPQGLAQLLMPRMLWMAPGPSVDNWIEHFYFLSLVFLSAKSFAVACCVVCSSKYLLIGNLNETSKWAWCWSAVCWMVSSGLQSLPNCFWL